MPAVFRVTTYELRDSASAFSGTSYTLTLNNDLVDDYFVMILTGGAGTGTLGPDENMIRVDADPHGNFGTSVNADELRFARGGSAGGNWQGSICVVECLEPTDDSGFTLLGVAEITMTDAATTGSDTVTAWSDGDQVGVYGGHYGGGAETATTAAANHPHVHAIFDISSTNTIDATREQGGGGGLVTAEWTAYAVEWGSNWTIQKVQVTGTNGGGGIDATGEYDTATITSVTRDNTWLTYSSTCDDNGIGDGASGFALALGDGVAQNASETTVAVGSEFTDTKTVNVIVHEHSDLAVDHRFIVDGTGIPNTALTGNYTIDAAGGSESYDNSSTTVRYTEGSRVAYHTSSSSGTGNSFPRPFQGSRHTTSTQMDWWRSRASAAGAVWAQSVDFEAIQTSGVTGTMAATLFAVTMAASGTAYSEFGPFAGTLPVPSMAAEGTSYSEFGPFAGAAPVPTMSSSGSASHTGTIATNLPIVSMASSGEAKTAGAFAADLPLVTMDASGTRVESGAFASDLPLPTSDASGTVTQIIGSVAADLLLPTMDASGTARHHGAFASDLPLPEMSAAGEAKTAGTLTPDLLLPTMSSDGTSRHHGTFASSLPLPDMASDGTVTAAFGPFAGTLPIPTMDAEGDVTTGGADAFGPFASDLPIPTSSASGTASHTGTVVADLPIVTMAASGTRVESGAFASDLPIPDMSASGTRVESGAFASDLPIPTSSAEGTVTAAFGPFAGTAPVPAMAASGTRVESGTITSNLPIVAMTSSGVASHTGTISTSLPVVIMSASGTVTGGVSEVFIDPLAIAPTTSVIGPVLEEEAIAFTWPLYLREYTTTDDTPVVTVLSYARATADAGIVSNLHVIGREDDGSRGNALVGAYTIMNNGATVDIATAYSNPATFGAGGLTISVAIVGDELHLTTTGIAATTVAWSVCWREMKLRAP